MFGICYSEGTNCTSVTIFSSENGDVFPAKHELIKSCFNLKLLPFEFVLESCQQKQNVYWYVYHSSVLYSLKLLRDSSKNFIGFIEAFERKAVNKPGSGPDRTNPWNLHVPIIEKRLGIGLPALN